MPFQHVFKHVAGYAPVNGKAHFFFGLDRPFAEYATGLYATLKSNPGYPYRTQLGDISFPLAKETAALQAADFLVYLTYPFLQEKVKKRHVSPSNVLRMLHRNLRHRLDISFQEENDIRATMKDIPLEQRGELFKADLAC